MGILTFTKKHVHDKELIQKLWQTFRIGQTTYVSYMIGLINFVLILYKLGGIEKYIDPLPFAILVAAILIPLGIILGIIHLKKQIPTESKIMAHHNPYVYKAIQHSKETMGLKTALWQYDAGKVANTFMIFQAEMNKKLWGGINEISKNEIFTKTDIQQMDDITHDLKIISEGIDDWKRKYTELYDGKSTQEIKGVEEYIEIKGVDDKE